MTTGLCVYLFGNSLVSGLSVWKKTGASIRVKQGGLSLFQERAMDVYQSGKKRECLSDWKKAGMSIDLKKTPCILRVF